MPILDVLYLDYFEDEKSISYTDRIDAAIERYTAKFGSPPNVCLVNEALNLEHPAVEVRPQKNIRPNHFWVGYEPKGA